MTQQNVRELARGLHYNEAKKSKGKGEKLTTGIRAKANQAIRKKGLDGNGRFNKPGYAVTAAMEALSQFGIEMDDVSSADRYRADSGSTSFALAWRNPEDPFSPTAIPNSQLYVSWTKLDPTKYEVVGYVT